jgi:hypothetical protein
MRAVFGARFLSEEHFGLSVATKQKAAGFAALLFNSLFLL